MAEKKTVKDKNKTVGAVSIDIAQKARDNDHSAEDQMREQLSDYESNILHALGDGKSRYITDFYVVVLTKKERLMPNVLRNYFFTRLSCPTPEYDQAVYKYHRSEDHLEFMWVVPSKHTCEMYKHYALEVPKEERELFQFVLDFEDRTLLKKALEMNAEIN